MGYGVGMALAGSDTAATMLLFRASFEGTNIATDLFRRDTGTMAIAQSGGFLVLNSASSTADAAFATALTYRTFPVYGAYPTAFEFAAKMSGESDASGSKTEFGVGLCLGSTGTVTDGVFFRCTVINGVVKLQGVLSNNATETTCELFSGASTLPTTGIVHRYRIEVLGDRVQFCIDESKLGSIVIPASLALQSSAWQGNIFTNVVNAIGATVARTLSVASINAYVRGMYANKPWSHQMCGMGGHSSIIQPGTVSGATASWAVAAAPSAFTPVAAGTGSLNALGGNFAINATASSEADLGVFAYVNAVASEALAGRTLYVTGIRIGETWVTGAVTGAAQTIMTWFAAAASSSAPSLAADGAAAFFGRRVPLGTHQCAAASAIGTFMSSIPALDLSASPIVVPSGSRLLVGVRVVSGTATASLVFRGTVTVVGYFE